jgi:hypothetical protein
MVPDNPSTVDLFALFVFKIPMQEYFLGVKAAGV